MKKILLSLLLSLCVLALYAEGIGTSKELLEFAAACNAGQSIDQWKNADGAVCLEADIDMSKVKKFGGIESFGGVFDGCGHAILNWKAQKGLFGEILAGGVVRNLRIDASCSMKAANKTEEYAVGFIADVNSGTVENCENHGSISHKSNYTEQNVSVGGLVGANRFAILRCRNFGNIESQGVLTGQGGEISIHIGGIAGSGALKTEQCPVIAWCENSGNISYSGDFPACNVGGVIGCGFRVPVKFCVNRGNVDVVTVQGEPRNPKVVPQARIGGVAGLTKGDVMCCDNFGSVTSSGTHAPNVGGVCAVPHAAVVVGDCVNYGTVKVSNDTAGALGGISGGVNRPARIRGCINHGEIIYEGFSPDRRSSVGGIVGAVTVKRDATAGTYVRNCANYGKVTSGPGGNKLENNDNAIHTGGVAGWMSGSDQAVVIMRDCENYGEVVAAGGRRGNISGACVDMQTGGEYLNDWAESSEPMSDGSTIFGRVTTVKGEPVAGVVVSDGEQCVATDGYGYYSMKSDMAEAKFVYISLPADYEIPSVNGVPYYYRRIARYEKAVMANFKLQPRAERSDKYTLLMVADPQMRPYGYDNSAETYRDSVIPDAEAVRSATEGECYAINLGDLVYNYMVAYDDYIDITSNLKCPTFNVMGNHDYDQTTLFDSTLGTMYFETYLGPTNYSFNIGRIHFIVLNDIVYNRATASGKYRSGLEEKALKWLENDLKFVPKSTTIVVCAHSQLFKKRVSHSTRNLNYDRYLALLSPYAKVYSWAGHNHENYYYDYNGKELGKDNISCITVSRSTGALRLNKYLNHDGTPQGYMVASVDGDTMTWYYKSVGRDRDYQMRVYPPLRTDGLCVVANIWNYGDGWSKAEWWENGVKVADMQQVEMLDPDYEALYATVTNKTTRKYCKPVKSANMFKVVPSENVRSGEVHVTDNFGNVYVSKIEW